MVNKEQQLKEIREACIKANPEILNQWHAWFDKYGNLEHQEKGNRPITLVDVFWTLLARYSTASREFIQLLNQWNLKETLENQSEECISFIHELIK